MSVRGTDRNDACNCPLPIVKWAEHGALGKYVEIRLCCMAEALAALVPGQTFFIEEDFVPEWKWDTKKSGEMPRHLKKRMR